ncbi:MAG: nitroreductase family protein [candidate division Zixibacteria bacterium]|nr:nitroreductase family protein [candidate division Zixibacteria bacterium]
MNLYDLIKKRRSVRNFKDQEIPKHIIEELLDAANNAPSGGNIQPISIILVQEPERRKELSKMVGDQPWVKNAPLSMIFCIDFFRIKKWASMFEADFKGEKALSHFLIAYADLMCSAQNVVILAESYGLGSVYIGTILDAIDKVRKYFTIPHYVLPMMVLSIGYPKSVPKNVPKLKRDVIVHREEYKELSDDEIKKAFEDKYGSFDDNLERYFQRIYVEAVEADKQEKPEWADPEWIKKEMKKLNIKNTAQFLFKFKYPSEEMVKLNENLIGAFKNAGFDFF